MERRGPPQGLRFDDRQGKFDRSANKFDDGSANEFNHGTTPIRSSSQPGIRVHGRLRRGSPVNIHSSTATSRHVGT